MFYCTVLGTIRENYSGLLKVKGAFVENYKPEEDIDSVKEQLAARSEQCHELFDAVQSLKKDYWNLEKQIKEQEKQLSENQKTIKNLEAERDRLQFMSDSIQNSYAVLEKKIIRMIFAIQILWLNRLLMLRISVK